MSEENPQGISSEEEQKARYKAALEHELEGAQAALKGHERYGNEAGVKVEKGHILDIEEELAKLGGASEDEAAAPKKSAADKKKEQPES